jgi:hypothetical protein
MADAGLVQPRIGECLSDFGMSRVCRILDSARSVVQSRIVLKRLGHCLLVVALLGATGGHWAVLQTVAWTDMLTGNLQTHSFTEAVTRTFDGEHPCKLCKQISTGRQAENKSELPFQIKKLEFVSERPAFVFSAPREFWLVQESFSSLDGLTHLPSVPPPRSLPV